MADPLQRMGLFVDQKHQVRLIEPASYQKSLQLQTLNESFLNKNDEFQDIVTTFINELSKVADRVEGEKFKAIGSRSAIKALQMEKEAMLEQYRHLIREKKLTLERLRMEHESLKRDELEQQNLLQLLRQLKR